MKNLYKHIWTSKANKEAGSGVSLSDLKNEINDLINKGKRSGVPPKPPKPPKPTPVVDDPTPNNNPIDSNPEPGPISGPTCRNKEKCCICQKI